MTEPETHDQQPCHCCHHDDVPPEVVVHGRITSVETAGRWVRRIRAQHEARRAENVEAAAK